MKIEDGVGPSVEELFEWTVGLDALFALDNVRRTYRAVRIAELVSKQIGNSVSPSAILENAKIQTFAKLSDQYTDDLLALWAIQDLSKDEDS